MNSNSGKLYLKDFQSLNTIFFSVDLNNGFCKEGALSSDRVRNLIPKTEKFLKTVLKSGFKVIAFTDSHGENSPEFDGYPIHCLADSPESVLVDELSFLYDHENAKVIPKNSTNGFFLLGDDILRGNFDNFIITGCCTDICIYQLAVTLKTFFNQLDQKKRIIVPKSLVDTFDSPEHNADEIGKIFLGSMASNGVEVVDELI